MSVYTYRRLIQHHIANPLHWAQAGAESNDPEQEICAAIQLSDKHDVWKTLSAILDMIRTGEMVYMTALQMGQQSLQFQQAEAALIYLKDVVRVFDACGFNPLQGRPLYL